MIRLIFIFLLTSSLITAQNGIWETIGDMQRPVAGGREWVDRENIYILGGYSDSLQADVDWVQKYSTFLVIWKQIGHMQARRFGLVADRFGEDVLFFGGVQKMSVNNTSIEKWGIGDSLGIIDFDRNFNRISSTGLIHNNKYYIIGGNPYLGGGGTPPYIIEYDLINSVVSYESTDLFVDEDLPEQQMSAIIGDDIYIFGGVNNSISQKIYKFNTVDHSFERLPVDLLEPRAAGRAILFEGHKEIFIMGGYNESSRAMNSVEVLKVSDTGYTIREIAPLNTARSHFMAAFLNDNIYVLGGYDENGDVVSDIEKLNYLTTNVERITDNNPGDYKLFQNYPNPFNPITNIEYQTPNNEHVSLSVYDILGNEITTLVNEKQPAGQYKVRFDGNSLASGLYFYKLTVNPAEVGADIFQQTNKMLLLK